MKHKRGDILIRWSECALMCEVRIPCQGVGFVENGESLWDSYEGQ